MDAIIRALREAADINAPVEFMLTSGLYPKGVVDSIDEESGVVEIQSAVGAKPPVLIRLDRIDAIVLH